MLGNVSIGDSQEHTLRVTRARTRQQQAHENNSQEAGPSNVPAPHTLVQQVGDSANNMSTCFQVPNQHTRQLHAGPPPTIPTSQQPATLVVPHAHEHQAHPQSITAPTKTQQLLRKCKLWKDIRDVQAQLRDMETMEPSEDVAFIKAQLRDMLSAKERELDDLDHGQQPSTNEPQHIASIPPNPPTSIIPSLTQREEPRHMESAEEFLQSILPNIQPPPAPHNIATWSTQPLAVPRVVTDTTHAVPSVVPAPLPKLAQVPITHRPLLKASGDPMVYLFSLLPADEFRLPGKNGVTHRKYKDNVARATQSACYKYNGTTAPILAVGIIDLIDSKTAKHAGHEGRKWCTKHMRDIYAEAASYDEYIRAGMPGFDAATFLKAVVFPKLDAVFDRVNPEDAFAIHNMEWGIDPFGGSIEGEITPMTVWETNWHYREYAGLEVFVPASTFYLKYLEMLKQQNFRGLDVKEIEKAIRLTFAEHSEAPNIADMLKKMKAAWNMYKSQVYTDSQLEPLIKDYQCHNKNAVFHGSHGNHATMVVEQQEEECNEDKVTLAAVMEEISKVAAAVTAKLATANSAAGDNSMAAKFSRWHSTKRGDNFCIVHGFNASHGTRDCNIKSMKADDIDSLRQVLNSLKVKCNFKDLPKPREEAQYKNMTQQQQHNLASNTRGVSARDVLHKCNLANGGSYMVALQATLD